MLKKSFWPMKFGLALALPYLIGEAMVDAELSRDAAFGGWVWTGIILGMAFWLYRITEHLVWLDIKGEGFVPTGLIRWQAKIRLMIMVKLLLVNLVLLAVARALVQPNWGSPSIASVYLGFTLFVFLITMWRRQVLQRWLRGLTEGTGMRQITMIDHVENIREPGWYLLQKYPAQVIRITEDRGNYVADMQLETARTWQPVCNQKERPIRMGKIPRLVRAISKSVAAADEWPENTTSEFRVSQ